MWIKIVCRTATTPPDYCGTWWNTIKCWYWIFNFIAIEQELENIWKHDVHWCQLLEKSYPEVKFHLCVTKWLLFMFIVHTDMEWKTLGYTCCKGGTTVEVMICIFIVSAASHQYQINVIFFCKLWSYKIYLWKFGVIQYMFIV